MTEKRTERRASGTGDPGALAATDQTPEPAATEEWPRTIRTTMEPWRDYRVGPEEYGDLKARGLIEEEK